ncbi:MAG: aminotransferase class I/II-fold pyridoxal phosphate-dependent enzyme, partial [Thermodesulfovibrionia bacterium]|nr:aminotransferase class I/II-fold pyridoxal phosphate-dependent enzyme [Thermodesulfovibrionia bacterium]
MKKIDIASLVKPHVRSLRAYNASEIPCRVKLDANESPYGFNALKGVKTNRYPDPEAKTLRKLVAREFKVKYENVLHGNGSDELIYYLITTFGGPVLYPVPTFSMYGIIAQALGEKKIEIPLDGEFDLNAGEFLKIMEQKKPGLIFLSSPNNPTGNCFSQGKIEKIVKGTKGLIVIDEAYNAFSGGGSFVPLLKKHKHLVILKTLSKIG